MFQALQKFKKYFNGVTLGFAAAAFFISIWYILPALASDYKLTNDETAAVNFSLPLNLNSPNGGNKLRNSLFAGKPFKVTGILTSSTNTWQTPVIILPSSECVNASAYITGMFVKVAGATNWSGYTTALTKVSVVDTSTNNVSQIDIASTALTSNNFVTLAGTGVTLSSAVYLQQGTANGQGLALVANSSATAGSNVYFTVHGFIY